MLKPSHVDSIAIVWGWRSVGNPGYGSVLTSKPRKPSPLLRGMAESWCEQHTIDQDQDSRLTLKDEETIPPAHHACVRSCNQRPRACQSRQTRARARQGRGKCASEWWQQRAWTCLPQSDQAWSRVQRHRAASSRECVSCPSPRLPHEPPRLWGRKQDRLSLAPAE